MAFHFTKKALLAGTALVAVSICLHGQAVAATDNPTANTTYSAAQSGTNGTNGTAAATGTSGTAGTEAVNTNANSITLINNSTITGGNGGNGGNSTGNDVAGTAGSAGGAGVIIDNTGVTLTNNATHTITGGNSGNGGNGTVGNANGGSAGAAGAGVDVTAATATITNAGTIVGGNAGNSGTATGTGVQANAFNGASGIILNSTGATLTNQSGATIRGGNGGTGVGTSITGTGVTVLGANNTINNAGTIQGQTSDAILQGGANGVITNSGSLTTTGTNAVIYVDTTGTGSTINNSGTIAASGTGRGLDILANLGANGLVNTGTISSTSGSAIDIHTGTSTTLFNNTGTISATSGTAVYVGGTLGTLTNLGNVTSSGTAATMILDANQTSGGNLVLNGVLTNTNTTTSGLALAIQQNQTVNRVVNTGSIIADGSATVGAGAGTAVSFANNITGTFENRGTLRGNVVATDGDQTFINTSGAMTGNINLGDGSNAAQFNGGSVTGTYTGGTGIDALTFGGGTISGAIQLNGGANTVAVNENYTTANTIGATGGSVNVTIANGKTFTVDNVISQLGGINVGTGATLDFNTNNASNAATGSLVNAGTVDIASNRTLSVDSYTAGTGTFRFNVNQNAGALTPGVLAVTGAGAANMSGSNIVFVVDSNAGVLPTAAVNFITSGNAATALTGATISDTSALYNFTTADTGNNLTVQAVRGSLVTLAGNTNNGNNAAVGASLDGNLASTNAGLVAIQGQLASANTQAQLNEKLESLTPTVDGSAVAASDTVTTQTTSLTQTRLAALRSSDSKSGANTGDGMAANRVWLQPFASTVDQDARNGIDGFKADTYGVTVGADTDKIADKMTVGMALSYGRTDADSANANNTQSDIDSYQGQVYADYDLGNRAFVQGAVGFGWNSIDQTRSNVGGVPGSTASADFNSQQYLASVGVGKTFDTGVQNLMLTPQAGVRYTHLVTDSYTENGAGGLSVDTKNVDALELGVGAELAYDIAMESGTLQPSVHAGYTHDVINDDIQTTSSFTGGGASFNTAGIDPAAGTVNAGAGVTFYSNSNTDVSVNYDAQVKSDYTAHAGYLKVVTKF